MLAATGSDTGTIRGRREVNIRDLEYVVAVAEHGHFGRAATACHVSQPALSGQVKKLEERLGLALFERTSRRVRITREGELIIARARELLGLVGEIESMAQTLRDPLAGRVRLGLIPTIGPYLAPLMLASLRTRLPLLQLVLHEHVTSELVQRLQDGSLDAIIVATNEDAPGLARIPLYDEPFWIVLPRGHRLEHEDELCVHDLRGEDLLLLADGHCLSDQVRSFCRTFNDKQDFDIRETSLETLFALVAAGDGVTFAPALSLRSGWMTDQGLITRRETSGEAMRSVQMVFRESFPRRALLERIADIVCALVPDTVKPARR